jgi:hypothetical protein
MPLYFFHLSFGDRTVPDDEGVELPNRSAARAEALAVIRDLSNPEVAGNPRRWASWFLQVADEGGEVLRMPIGHPALEVVTPDGHQTEATIRGETDPARHDSCRPRRPPIGNACSADISGEETHRTITPTQSTAAGRAFFRMSRQREHTGTRQPLGFACPVCFADGRNRSLPRRNQAGAPRSSPSGPAARQGVECS